MQIHMHRPYSFLSQLGHNTSTEICHIMSTHFFVVVFFIWQDYFLFPLVHIFHISLCTPAIKGEQPLKRQDPG